MAMSGEEGGVPLEILQELALRKDLEVLATRKDVVKGLEKVAERNDLEKLATRKDIDALARQADVQAIAVQVDDVRGELIEECKGLGKRAEAQFDQLWTFLSNPLPDASLPLLQEVMACLRPPQSPRRWWYRYQWPAVYVLAGLLVGGGSMWWIVRPSAVLVRWAQLGSQLDKVVGEQAGLLPKAVQEAVQAVYRQVGWPTPSERKGKR